MRLVFWQNMLAFYQAPHIRALAAKGFGEVVWVTQEDLSPDRRALGWSLPDAGQAKVIAAPDSATIDCLIHAAPEESTHIFTTISAYPTVKEAFMRCVPTKARMGLLVETANDRGWKGFGRLLLRRREFRKYGDRLDFILSMGQSGEAWYQRCGMPASKIFPYGYFPEAPASLPDLGAQAAGPVELMYLGQCIPRKGVDILIRALASVKDLDWRLHIVGDGPAKAEWSRLAEQLGLSDRLIFHPVLANAVAMEKLAQSDLFVLPSRFDGWGVVINEALLRGVPVICSDRCGACTLLDGNWRGETFPSESAAGLSQVLRRWISRGKRTPEATQRLVDWSRCLHGETAADYLLAVLAASAGQGPRPTPPWRI